MEKNQKITNQQIEIHDLLDEAIDNAIARRNQSLDIDMALSDDEAENITGGRLIAPIRPIAIAGFKPIRPPIIVGLLIAPIHVNIPRL